MKPDSVHLTVPVNGAESLSDRELLELAAKAAGLVGKVHEGEIPQHCGVHLGGGLYFNPLADDAQAFQLAVKLRMEVSITDRTSWAMAAEDVHAGKAEEHGTDALAATRRAIVRAAAALS